jgi:hypothetical protein
MLRKRRRRRRRTMPKHKAEYDVDFERAIYQLRRYEYGDVDKYSQNHKTLLEKQIARLMERKNYLVDIDIWREIYERSICFYPFCTDIAGIPCSLITKHNYILRDFMKRNLHLSNDTLVHFDTHDDFNTVDGNKILPELYRKYLQTKKETFIQEAQDIVHDIGAAVSGLLLTTGNRDNVWVVPNWIPDKNGSLSYFMRVNKKSITFVTNDPHHVNFKGKLKEDSFSDVRVKVPEGEKRIYGKYQVTNNAKWRKNISHLRDAIARNGRTFILDIDLDFFVSNGEELTDEYFHDGQDVKSDLRVQETEVNLENPRDAFEKTDKFLNLKKKMNKEVAAITDRIKNFQRTLKFLKDDGFVPSLINICDSTNVEFVTNCAACTSTCNNYMPKHLALFVHTKVRDLLEDLYTTGEFPRKPPFVLRTLSIA